MAQKRLSKTEKKENSEEKAKRLKMQKEKIIAILKKNGCRITKQRLIILDVILENECSSSKEIYYKASKIDEGIGTATVYRMINTLEEVGAINRKNMYRVEYKEDEALENVCTVVLDDDTTCELSGKTWKAVVKAGLSAYGYLKNQRVRSVILKESE